jgi:gliding motility-associated-like protein
MKTKSGLFLLFGLLSKLTINAQTIDGPDFICLGDCGYYQVLDPSGTPMDEVFFWDFGNGETYNAANVFWCPWDFQGTLITVSLNGNVIAEFQFYGTECCGGPLIIGPSEVCAGDCADFTVSGGGGGGYSWQFSNGSTNSSLCPSAVGTYGLTVTDFNGCTAEMIINVFDVGTPEIFSQSGAFCLNDPISSCEKVCENTTVTYTTEVINPGLPINWSIFGAESWVENGNEVTVDWGDPGQGQVAVSVGSGSGIGDWFLTCGTYKSAGLNSEDGTAFISIDGPQGIYNVQLDDPSNSSYTNFGNNTITYLDGLAAGTYTVVVSDNNSISQSCSFTIVETDITCPAFGVNLDVNQGSGQGCCNSSIESSIIGNATPPFTYQWDSSTGDTTPNISGFCAGTEGSYSLTVTDSEGCVAISSVYVYCSPQGCYGYNSLCVEILEVPEAAFVTNPPVVNGVIEICEGQTVFFDNQTNGGFNYTWDFGDGVSSSLVDAEHTYLSAGTYEAILIARNDCFCGDSSAVSIIVQEAITPKVDCAGTICPGEEVTYTSNSDCTIFNWNISSNGTIISGGSSSDNFITVDWGAGPEGVIELLVDGCNGDYCVETLFKSIPIIDDNAEIEGPERVCKGAEVIYSLPSFAGTEFIWGVSSFGTISEGQGSNEITVQWVNEVTPIQQQITVQYESCYLGCGGADTLLVNILNEVFIEGPIEVCPDEMATYTCQTPIGGIVNADWTVFNNVGVVVATSASPTSNYTLDWSIGSGNYTVHADVQNPSNYCIDNFSVFVEVVSPTALPNSITGELDICPGTSYTYTGNSGAGSYDYTWYVTDGVSNFILNGKTVNVIWGASPPYILQLTQTNLEGLSCESDAISASPNTINSVSLSGTPFLCYEETGTYTATDFDNLDYQWQVVPSDAGSIIGEENDNEVEIQWNAPGTHDIQVMVCGVSSTFSVTVYPPPIPVPLFSEVCPGQLGAVSIATPYVSYDWRNESGTTVSTSPTPNLGGGYYEVIVTNNNGCTGNETFFIGEYPQPDVTISTPDFGNFCAVGGSMTLYALESSSGPLDYQWYYNGSPFGTNSSSQVITQEGSYYVLVTDTNGCTDYSNTLTLNCASLPGNPNPACIPNGFPAFGITQGAYCNESQYTNMSVNDVANTWSWQFWDIVGGGISSSGLENPMHTWTNAGFNLVVLQVGINSVIPGEVCPMVVYSFDTIPLAANFVYEGACAMEPVTFTDISTYIPQTNITGWFWDFGDPASGVDNTSTSQNPQHIYNSGGFYTITQSVTDQSGCISQKQKTIEIKNPPATNFVVPEQSCEGASLLFQANGSYTNINWDFGDPASGDANISNINGTHHVYTTPGVYTVTLNVENVYGCAASTTEEVYIEANGLNGIINVNPALEVCAGDSVVLTAPPADTYSWSTGLQTQSITVFDAGTYEITIYDAIGCGYSPPSVTIDLIPLPQGQITAVEYNEFDQPIDFYYNNYETCYGDDVYLEITENTNYTYNWSTGETNTDVSFTEEKDNLLGVGTHIFTVTITDSNTGCTNVVGPFTVTVHPIPENILIVSMPVAPVCENTPTVMSVFNPDPAYTYIWNTGQVGTSINTFYAGKYFVRAINQFGCEGESNTLEIVPGPNVDLIPSGCHTRCNPDTICLPPIYGISSFQWYLNGSPIAPPEGNDPDFIATESGEYFVEMISVDGCVTISDILTLDLYDAFGSVQGNVYFDLNDNGIIDAADTLMSGIGIILQNGGVNVDTLTSNQFGSFSFSNILSTDYELIVDELNLPPGMIAIISQANAQLVGCDDEEMVEFLIQFICPDISEALSLSACPGDMVNYNGMDLNIGDIQSFVLSTPVGCDSTVTVTVLALDSDSSSIQLQACIGSTTEYNGTDLDPGTQTDFIFTNAIGCDSIVTVIVDSLQSYSVTENLTACSGQTAMYNGTSIPAGTTEVFTFNTINNCDSTVTVVVEELIESSATVQLEACENGSVLYDGTALLPNSSTDFTYTNTVGCDSTVTVMVGTLLESVNAVSFQACTGSTVNYNGTSLTPGSVTDFTFQNGVGCDSIVTVTVIESDQDSSSIQLMACVGSTTDYNGTALDPGTQTDFTFSNNSGCDSVITVIVNPLQNYSVTENLSACEGQSAIYNGTSIVAGTTQVFNFNTINNCDSTVTVIVAELTESTLTVQLDACESGSVLYDGTALLPNSTTDFTYTNAVGCDSIVTVIVGTLNESTNSLNLQACTGSTVDYNGTALSPGTQTDFLFTNSVGCDSIVTVTVDSLQNYSVTENLSACEGQSATYNGTSILAGMTEVFVFNTVNNCDSTVTVVVAELTESTETVELAACDGDNIIYDGVPLNPGSSTEFVYTNAVGCDSTVTVQVAELPLYSFDLELSACEGQTVEYNGDDLAAGSVTQYIFTSEGGCDSTMTVIVETLIESVFTLNVSACDGQTYPYNGNDLPSGSSADFVFTNAVGCDSVVTVNVGTYSITETFVDLFVCTGETIEFEGNQLGEGFEDIFILTDQNGCDSLITVSVTAHPDFDFEVLVDPACWNDNNGMISIENLIGGTGPFQFSIDGLNYQDSTIFENLNEGAFMVAVIDDNGCEEIIEILVNEISPLEIISNDPEVPCDFSPVRLELENLSNNAGPISYVWENGSVQSFITVDTAGVYAVEISNACETIEEQYSVSLAVDARKNYFYVPNVFSPNDDGMNDVWQIKPPEDMEVLTFDLKVFDRWGNLMKSFTSVNDFWDGTFKDKDLNPGVYVWWYQAKVVSCGKTLEVFDKGDVTVVK